MGKRLFVSKHWASSPARRPLGVTIRQAIMSDRLEIAALDADLYPADCRPASLWRDFLCSQGIACWVAEYDNVLIGFALAEGHACHLSLLAVATLTRYRPEGVDGVLLRAAIAASRELGRDALVRAVVRETDLSAQLLLKAHGFRWVRTWGEWFGNEAGYEMVRRATADLPVVP